MFFSARYAADASILRVADSRIMSGSALCVSVLIRCSTNSSSPANISLADSRKPFRPLPTPFRPKGHEARMNSPSPALSFPHSSTFFSISPAYLHLGILEIAPLEIVVTKREDPMQTWSLFILFLDASLYPSGTIVLTAMSPPGQYDRFFVGGRR